MGKNMIQSEGTIGALDHEDVNEDSDFINDEISNAGNSDNYDFDQDEDHKDDGTSTNQRKMTKVHRLSLKKTTDFNEVLQKRGVIYIARIPPRMTPTKVKALLSDFGEVTRVYLQEEDPTARKRRRKEKGGNGGSKRYIEGWVEMSSKSVAKHVALSLHMAPISNNKRSPHYGVLWNLKYLTKFKWSHLTEKVAYERRVREQKLRLETLQARRETANYKQLVETGKKLDKIEERKRKQMERDSTKVDGKEATNIQLHRRKHARQLQPIDDGVNAATKRPLLDALVK